MNVLIEYIKTIGTAAIAACGILSIMFGYEYGMIDNTGLSDEWLIFWKYIFNIGICVVVYSGGVLFRDSLKE